MFLYYKFSSLLPHGLHFLFPTTITSQYGFIKEHLKAVDHFKIYFEKPCSKYVCLWFCYNMSSVEQSDLANV